MYIALRRTYHRCTIMPVGKCRPRVNGVLVSRSWMLLKHGDMAIGQGLNMFKPTKPQVVVILSGHRRLLSVQWLDPIPTVSGFRSPDHCFSSMFFPGWFEEVLYAFRQTWVQWIQPVFFSAYRPSKFLSVLSHLFLGPSSVIYPIVLSWLG